MTTERFAEFIRKAKAPLQSWLVLVLIFFMLGVMAVVGTQNLRFNTATVRDVCAVAAEHRRMWRDVANEVVRRSPQASSLGDYIHQRTDEAERRAPVRCPVEQP